MNQTLLNLQVKGLRSLSPFLSLSASSRNIEFRISNSVFSRTFSSIFYAKNSPSLTKFKNTHFDRILNSAIYVNQDFELTDQTFTKMSPIDHQVCYIKRCTFTKCESRGSGGGVQYNNAAGELHIIQTNFFEDSCTNSGGAVYFSGSKYFFMQICIDKCYALNKAMTFYIQPTSEEEGYINYSMSSLCAPKIVGSVQYNLHHNGGHANYFNDNITKGLADRAGASIACLKTVIHNIFYTHICTCKGASVISIEFGKEKTDFKYCNIINNTHTQSQILIFSQTTQFTECFIVGNRRPFTSGIVTGKRFSITFEKCLYDALGIEPRNEIIINEHRDYNEEEDFTIAFENDALAICVKRKSKVSNIWKGVSFAYILMVTFGILIAHISFIHPRVWFDIYYHTFFDSDRQERRKRAHPISL